MTFESAAIWFALTGIAIAFVVGLGALRLLIPTVALADITGTSRAAEGGPALKSTETVMGITIESTQRVTAITIALPGRCSTLW